MAAMHGFVAILRDARKLRAPQDEAGDVFGKRYGGRSRAAIHASARYAASIRASSPTTVRLPPYTPGNISSITAIDTTVVSHTTAPHGVASHNPTAATSSMTAK